MTLKIYEMASKVVFNGASHPQEVNIKKGDWKIVAKDGKLKHDASLGSTSGGKMTLAPYSALILMQQ